MLFEALVWLSLLRKFVLSGEKSKSWENHSSITKGLRDFVI